MALTPNFISKYVAPFMVAYAQSLPLLKPYTAIEEAMMTLLFSSSRMMLYAGLVFQGVNSYHGVTPIGPKKICLHTSQLCALALGIGETQA